MLHHRFFVCLFFVTGCTQVDVVEPIGGFSATGEAQGDVIPAGADVSSDTPDVIAPSEADGQEEQPVTSEVACLTDADCPLPGDSACQFVSCNTDTGLCEVTYKKNFTPCDDGDACTQDEVCHFGVCSKGIGTICDDGNVCTDDTCDPGMGCRFDFNTNACDDGNGCTTGDSCAAGACIGQPSTACACSDDATCLAFEDGDLCNGTLACIGGQCVHAPESKVTCDDVLDGPCSKAVCNPGTGLCEQQFMNEFPCSDGNPCTEGDTCLSGACVGTPAACVCEQSADCDV